jgi:hypothetical protein
MIRLLLTNLNILLRSNYYDKTTVDKFKYFIKNKTIIHKFNYFINIKLL